MESLIGKMIDNYHILEVIGRGGMGVVLKALDTDLDKIVALKMIDPFLASDENFIRRFKTEAKALAKLENPNIVVVHALRKTEAGFFMVMEYVEPRPLSKHISENGSLNVKETIGIAKQLLNAIGHAHKSGIIHRDIKPSNILIGFDGKIKVTDFGLAKVVQQKGHESTVTQARAGTLYYMSPEQIKGLKNVDIRGDLYSLGMTIYEMIAGKVPFDKTDSDYSIQKQIVEGEIPSPIQFNSNIPQKLVKIILKSIDKDPDKRYQNAQEMLDDFVKFEKVMFEKEEEIKSQSNIKTIIKPATKTFFKSKKIFRSKTYLKFIKNPIFIISSAVVSIIIAVLYFVLSPSLPYLSIETTPSEANIKINNVEIGKSPIKHDLNKEGVVRVSISKEGYASIDTSLILVSGQHENINIFLQPVPKEKISIITDPESVGIFINDRLTGNSPLLDYTLNTGEHQIRIEKEGYLSIDTTVRIIVGLNPLVKFKMMKTDSKDIGRLIITTVPIGAFVFLDGRKKGKTPYENKELLVKTYLLKLQKEGFVDLEEKIIITKSQPNIINKVMTPLNTSTPRFANIKITTNPIGANVFLNENMIGTTPIEKYKTGVGDYKMSIKKSGYIDFNLSITITSDTSINQFLTPAGKLTVNSSPIEAEVFIDNNNKPLGKTPFIDYQMILGKYTITIKKEGFKNYSEKIVLSKSEPTKNIEKKLTQLFSKINISINPKGDIYIDGKLFMNNVISINEIKLPFGKHIIEVVNKELDKKKSFEINVEDENPKSYSFNLYQED